MAREEHEEQLSAETAGAAPAPSPPARASCRLGAKFASRAKNLVHLMNFQGGDGGATECIFELADKLDGSNNE
jgi:hypothetical protein